MQKCSQAIEKCSNASSSEKRANRITNLQIKRRILWVLFDILHTQVENTSRKFTEI